MTSQRIAGAAALAVFVIAAPGRSVAAPPAAAHSLTAHDEQVKALLAKMTLDEKVGQMTQADNDFLKDPTDVKTYFLGSVLSGGSSDPKTNSLRDWTSLYDHYQSEALGTRLKIPILYGVDAVHGHSNVIGAVIFPHNIGLGATRDAALVEEIGRVTAEEIRATGIQWAFAPCVTVPQDIRWGRTYEGFSEDPKLVAELGAAAVRGLQGKDLSDPAASSPARSTSPATAARRGTPREAGARPPRAPRPGGHPRGRGHAAARPSPRLRDGRGGRRGLDHALVQQLERGEVLGNKHLLTDILKTEMGFEGFLISDYNAIDQLPGDFAAQVRQSINAGMDMVMAPRAVQGVLHDA